METANRVKIFHLASVQAWLLYGPDWLNSELFIMRYWYSSAIWISTDKFRFDYKLKSDTLIEFDKLGDQEYSSKCIQAKKKSLKNDLLIHSLFVVTTNFFCP